jgi:hypothetical protein
LSGNGHRAAFPGRLYKEPQARATGHITEILLGKYPGASPHMLYTFRDCLNNFNKILTLVVREHLFFRRRADRVDLKNFSEW